MECLFKWPCVYAQKRSHYQPNATVWDENCPEKLFEEFQVFLAIDDKTPVGKTDEHASKDETEERRVGKYHIEQVVGDVQVLAPEHFVTLRHWNHQKTETMRCAENPCCGKITYLCHSLSLINLIIW